MHEVSSAVALGQGHRASQSRYMLLCNQLQHSRQSPNSPGGGAHGQYKWNNGKIACHTSDTIGLRDLEARQSYYWQDTATDVTRMGHNVPKLCEI